ncbi:MAG: carboxylesterase family protein [Bermanella sp.]
MKKSARINATKILGYIFFVMLVGCQTEISITTPVGDIIGQIESDHLAFLGIPYAKPPIDALRWTKPVAADNFREAYKATEFQAGCHQFAQMNSIFNASEDCLYLNIWRPNSDIKNLPVMVYLHGGGMATGAGSEARYNGQVLAKNQNVIVVTLNYRLGFLGLLSLTELTEETGHSGNYAFLDQNMALQWVNKNIESFGGDPQRVTLFGESAGANGTCFHTVSPLSRDLFQNAILQSQGLYGSCINTIQTQQQAHDNGDAFATAAGCKDNTLACLRDKSVFEIRLALFLSGFRNGPLHASTALPLLANIDGNFLHEQPFDTFEHGEVNDKNILMGVNKNEGTLFSSFDENIDNKEQYLQVLKQKYPINNAEISQLYPFETYENGNQAMADILGDQAFVCRSQSLANSLSTAGSDVYFYHFTQSVDSYLEQALTLFSGNGLDLGTYHTAEIPYVFGVESIFGNLKGAKQITSNLLQDYWGNFARTGSVNTLAEIPENSGSSLPHWPLYTANNLVYMNLQENPQLQFNLKQRKCQFWLSHSF